MGGRNKSPLIFSLPDVLAEAPPVHPAPPTYVPKRSAGVGCRFPQRQVDSTSGKE
jgi:hypothetical protein